MAGQMTKLFAKVDLQVQVNFQTEDKVKWLGIFAQAIFKTRSFDIFKISKTMDLGVHVPVTKDKRFDKELLRASETLLWGFVVLTVQTVTQDK